MRTAKILGLVVGGVILIVALLLLSVYLFVDPNPYKDKIAAAVKDATGRDLVLQGDIKLAMFPWVALELGPASLGNPPGFAGEPFVSFQHAAVRARLLPLLQERLEVARVEIDGLDVRLEKNAAGQGNWQSTARPDPRAPATAPAPASAGGASQPLEGLAGIKVTNARVRYQNFTLENFNLETTPFVDGVVPIAVRFDVNRGVATESASVEIKVDCSNPAPQRYRVAALNVVGQIHLAGDPRPIRWNFATPSIVVDLAKQTVAAPVLALSVAGAQLNGSVQGTSILDDAHFSGAVTLAPVLMREFMPRWGLNSPQTRDPRAFSQLSGSVSFAYGGNALQLEPLALSLDDTHVQGRIAITNLTTQALSFDLAGDRIDADRYLAPEDEPAPPAAVSQPATPATAPASRPLQAQGTFSFGALHASRLDLTNLKLSLAAKDGVLRVYPLQAQLDGGHYTGDITVDSRGSVPLVSMDEHLSGVDMATLLATSSKKIHVSGRGNVDIKAAAHGAAAQTLLKSLNGHLDAYVTGGAVEGIDMGYQLGRAEALLKRQDMPPAPDAGRTPFDAFKMSAEITNGLAVTRDLVISSPLLKVTGQGSAQLATQVLDFSLLADTLHSTQGLAIQIPVKVTGTTADPVVRPDIAALAKGQLKQKVQDVLHDQLKSLFGKP